ncbi:MAG: histidine kinase [Bacteroidetes bacterium GWA2_32_17]|nr:MAG: histidine kinase [Bacteroidetes bacterium GWA2_32_17]
MLKSFTNKRISRQYIISVGITLLVSTICFFISDLVGYRTVALILLFTVSLLASALSVYPVLISAVLSALIWDFFFIPPHFTLHVDNSEDILMLCMYFIIALLNGILSSKLKQYEKIARQKEEKLNALKLYNTLFNSISHELRTPLTTIIGASENLITNDKILLEKDKLELQSEIYIASSRLNRLIDNLLNMSRLDSGFLKPKMDWCDINDLIHSVVNRLQPDNENHSIEIKVSNDNSIIWLDFGLIEQSLYNVIHNAIVHSPDNTKIIITAEYMDGYMIIKVADNGNGFITDGKEQSFDKFYRSPELKTGGLGLGLSIVKGFVSAHNGFVEINNNKPNGTIVTIKIPSNTPLINSENE